MTKQERAEELRRRGWIGRGNSWRHPSQPMLISASLAAAERMTELYGIGQTTTPTEGAA